MKNEKSNICIEREEAPSSIMEVKQSKPNNILQSFFESYSKKGNPRSVDEAFLLLEQEVDEDLVRNIDLKKLKLKIDIRILPLATLSMFLFSLDKAVLSYGTLMGFLEDKNLDSDQYSWVSSIFSFGYLAANIPIALLIQKVPLSKFISMCMIIWSCILFGTIAHGAKYHTLMAIRCLMGVFEASLTPSLAIMFSSYYTRREQASRMCIWYLGNPLNHIFGSLIAYGFSGHKYSIAPWAAMYICVCCASIFCAICFFFLIPDTPAKASFLSKEERVAVVERLRESSQGFGNKEFKPVQALELLLDIRTYIYFVLQYFSNVGWSATSSFGNLFVHSLGFSSRKSLLLNIATGGILGISLLIFGFFSEIMNDRTLWGIVSCLFGVIGGAIMVGVGESSVAASITGYYLTYASIPLYIFVFILVAGNTPGHTKKVLSNCVCLLGATSGSISGPQLVKNDPKYHKLKVWNLVSFSVCFIMLVIYRFLNIIENKRRDKEEFNLEEKPHNIEFMDLTAKQNQYFRYVL